MRASTAWLWLALSGCGVVNLDTRNERAVDGDGDGFALLDGDCDDANPASTVQSDDHDCDGIVTASDCDDADPSNVNDRDCDGLVGTLDCDDADPESHARAEDDDCDGIFTAGDCDDEDPFVGARAVDADCDGTLTEDDCDDANPTSTRRRDDADCDGVLTAADCDDADAGTVGDMDCDGVPVQADCSDTDATSPVREEDADCDGIPTAGDCDDEDPDSVLDMDCDGVQPPLDCNDRDAATWPGAPETPSDGVDQDCDGTDGVDSDGDGYASVATGGADCDDTKAARSPAGVEDACDGVDNDCDLVVDDGAACPVAPRYMDAGAPGDAGHAYLFIDNLTERVDWYGARALCMSYGNYDMFAAETAMEWDWATNMLNTSYAPSGNIISQGWWLGLRCSASIRDCGNPQNWYAPGGSTPYLSPGMLTRLRSLQVDLDWCAGFEQTILHTNDGLNGTLFSSDHPLSCDVFGLYQNLPDVICESRG
jgi:hypothetical protein